MLVTANGRKPEARYRLVIEIGPGNLGRERALPFRVRIVTPILGACAE